MIKVQYKYCSLSRDKTYNNVSMRDTRVHAVDYQQRAVAY